ncbi:hypothetical protein [Clostridium sp. Marseille-P299]|uniref:hypothetical protein n=1 Tax=Clostridium sp. Marseille-P299 TaxID=1805477 RepID=UPI00082FFC49|nr:hypothetical protein [Clostridium sp. Marseille-P299]
MSKKSELIQVFKEFKDRYNTVQEKVTEVQKSDAYTDIGRERTIGKIMEEFKPIIQLYHDKAITIIDSGLAALLEKWKANSTGRLADTGYQIGLGNVIKIIESGAIHDREDMQNIIDIYKEDFNAMAAIRNILSKSPQNLEFLGLIPLDNREYNKKLLGDLKNNVELQMNHGMTVSGINTVYTFLGTSSTSMSMDSMADFVNTRFADDLSLIQ